MKRARLADNHSKCLHMRDVKKLKAERALQEQTENCARPTKKAWNGRVVRHGDRIHVDAVAGEEELVFSRSNQITPEAVLLAETDPWRIVG